jgi:hypothetical protein
MHFGKRPATFRQVAAFATNALSIDAFWNQTRSKLIMLPGLQIRNAQAHPPRQGLPFLSVSFGLFDFRLSSVNLIKHNPFMTRGMTRVDR